MTTPWLKHPWGIARHDLPRPTHTLGDSGGVGKELYEFGSGRLMS